MTRRFEWVTRVGRAASITRAQIEVSETGITLGNDAPIPFSEITAIKLEHLLRGLEQSRGFHSTRMDMILVGDGRTIRLRGSLSSPDDRADFVAALTAVLERVETHRPDLRFREVKEANSNQDLLLWGYILIAFSLVFAGYGAFLAGSDVLNWAWTTWVNVTLGAAMALAAVRLMIWPAQRAPEHDVSATAVATRLEISPRNLLKIRQHLPNVMIAGPLEPNDFGAVE